MKIEKTPVKTKPSGKKTVALDNVNKSKENSLKSSRNSHEIHDVIRLKAYELYLERNGGAGDDLEDWLTAQRIVLQNVS